MRILGIDPGYAIVGFGALDYTRNTFTTLQYGAITTKAHTTFEDRLSEIYDDMTQLLAAVKPDAMAIETLFYTTNQKREACCCCVPGRQACRCSNIRRCR